MKTIDARGKQCPEPVIMTKTLVDRGEERLEVLLDNPTSASNVKRFLESRGFEVQLRDDDGQLTISGNKQERRTQDRRIHERRTPERQAQKGQIPPVQASIKAASQTPGSQSVPSQTDVPDFPAKETFSVLVTCKTLGRDDPQLGEVLMKSFLGTLSQLSEPPFVVALMNEGVKLAVYDSSSCDHLKNLEKKGVAILVCGTCVNHFQIADQIGAGTISNMFEILETLNKADKILTL
ncbi:MAG: sulfurtransferase-like selenium metabolism protein YedF [Synergistaceae bacterium]|nr:sulfurtransferase-like selenium metabolism protein YedF [Synergistaceae bacterium]